MPSDQSEQATISSFTQNEGRPAQRIPFSNPDWTEFNVSEPRITLIELFAYVADNLQYRSNQAQGTRAFAR
jgi:hypothetical protein